MQGLKINDQHLIFYGMAKSAKAKGKTGQMNRFASHAKDAEKREKGRREVKAMYDRPHFKYSEAYKPLPMTKMQAKANRYTSDMKKELQKARNSRDRGDSTENVRAFKRHHYNKDERTNKIEGILGKRRRIRQQVDMRNSDPQAYSSSRQSRSVENKAKHLKKSL